MQAIGFNFTKISAEKSKTSGGQAKINTNINITDVSQPKNDLLKTKGTVLEVSFEYRVNYEPNFAKISIEGVAILDVEQKIADEVLKHWKKKETPEEFRLFAVNVIIQKSTLKALNLCDELNLPLHVPFPLLKKNQDQ